MSGDRLAHEKNKIRLGKEDRGRMEGFPEMKLLSTRTTGQYLLTYRNLMSS